MKRIVITGLGAVTSIGLGWKDFWVNLLEGRSGISKITVFDTSRHVTHVGGEVKSFRPEDFIPRAKIKYIGRASQLAIAATKMALADAKLEKELYSEVRTSVCLGTTMGEIRSVETADHSWINSSKDKHQIDPFEVYRSSVNNIPSNVAIAFHLKGRNRIFTTACASGNYAIGYGFDLLRSGKTDLVVAGGADALSWIAFTGFNKVSATAPERCQPFDKNRLGMIPGEGSGVLVLEDLDSALLRGAPIYAEILGYGLSCDANHMTNPNPEGVAACMRNAMLDAGIKPRDVDYISAHGTGTIFNDRTESAAINEVFGKRSVKVSSIKSMLGHTMGAASAIEAIACCLALKDQVLPPTINYETPDPECDIDCIPNAARKQKVDVVLNNGFAFGGNNACVVLKRFTT
ncbi:MAG: beta-ketoacyl-[acyl-carrier-protein] synthase family protein [Candidatus Omnitrophica bacterium]|nr:beta-ketoacyl-[acyl-carrier-protein] synthase family protein [Candidatus Omnitrophota bacterium]